ncbi:MAG: calcium-binding protein, partial [Lentilitoribacter sp.]
LLETLLPDAGIDYSSQFYQELKVQAGYQIAMADQNHDVIQTEGHFFSIGSDGDDTIISNLVSDMDSVLMGGKGDDYLYGSEGTQIYIYSLGDGNDTIFDNSLQGEMDRLIFTDIKYDEVVFKGKNKDTDSIYDFVEIHLPDGAIITLENYILHPHANGIEFVELSDGTELDRAQVFQAVVDEQSSEGDDIIIGLQFDDILDGGLGNDVLQGGTGADTYVYNFGDGNDIIQDISSLGELDNLHLNDVNATDVIFSGNENDDLIVTMSDGATITIEGQFDGFNKAIEIVEFADGTTLGLAGIATKLIADQTTDGDDTIKGSNLDDLITGGLGDDLIEGGKGADTYVYALGDGHDVIEDYDGSAVNDKILFSDLNADDVTFNRNSGDDLVISTSDGGTITVTDHFDNGAEDMEVIEFADGTTLGLDGIAVKAIVDQSTSGDDIILGTDGDDVVTAGLGDDSIEGGKGANIYHYSFGDGSDVIKDLSAYGETDKLIFGDLNASDVLFSISGDDDLVITMSDDATITVWDHFDGSTEQIEQIEFADGTVLDLEAISSKAVADQVPQEPEEVASNDTITGTTGDDTLQGGLGDDQIDGGRGSDTYIYRLGDGHDYIKDVSSYSYEIDTLLFTDVNASDVTFNQNSGDDLIITLSDGGTVTIDEHYDSHTKDMEQIQFADGSVLDVDAIAIKMLEDASTSGNDTIYGTSGADTIEGGLGDDRLEGGRDGDTYVYNFGDGHDYIKDVSSYAETDTLVFTDLNASDVVFSENNDDLVITMSDGGTVTIYEHFDSHTKDMEQVQFADGIILDLVGIEDKLQDDSLLIA